MRTSFVLASVALVVLACGSSDGASSSSSSGGTTLSSELKNGTATYYTADGAGNCGFDRSPNDLDVAAFDTAEYAGSASCGSCQLVKGPKGTITVRIVDQCPDCDANHLDLSQSAFAKIADPSLGHVEITYQTVPCDVSGPIAYHLKDGSSNYWTAIQIRNHRLPINKVEYKKAGAYVEMKREDYNYFVAESGVGDQPAGLAVRVTAIDGQTLEDVLPGTVPADVTIQGNAQFK